MNLGRKAVNPNLSQLVRAKLLAHGLHLKDWAKAMEISLSQVSMALSGYRTDARSRSIRTQLSELVEGGSR